VPLKSSKDLVFLARRSWNPKSWVIGDTSIELICDTEPVLDDPMVRVVMGQKGVINHLCFEVDDLETSIKKFEKNGAKLVESCPRPGGHGRIAFFYPETTEGVLIELCEV
jgi:methylmalonyl-CoA/ethylmalonyl-CoA epimerase